MHEHLEELPGECARRAALLTSPRARRRDLRWLDERIAGRLDALRLQPDLVQPALADLIHDTAPPDTLDGPNALAELRERAILCPTDGVDEVLARCSDPILGPERFGILASLGHPSVVTVLLTAIGGDDPESACAASAALARLLDVGIDSERMWTPTTGDDFEDAFVVPRPLPDPERARLAWEEARPRLEHARRIAAGQDLDGDVDEEELDLLSLRELAQRRAASGDAKALERHERFTARLAEPYVDGDLF